MTDADAPTDLAEAETRLATERSLWRQLVTLAELELIDARHRQRSAEAEE